MRFDVVTRIPATRSRTHTIPRSTDSEGDDSDDENVIFTPKQHDASLPSKRSSRWRIRAPSGRFSSGRFSSLLWTSHVKNSVVTTCVPEHRINQYTFVRRQTAKQRRRASSQSRPASKEGKMVLLGKGASSQVFLAEASGTKCVSCIASGPPGASSTSVPTHPWPSGGLTQVRHQGAQHVSSSQDGPRGGRR